MLSGLGSLIDLPSCNLSGPESLEVKLKESDLQEEILLGIPDLMDRTCRSSWPAPHT